MRLHEFFDQSDRIAVFCYGRMNPPTIGHEKLITEGKIISKKYNGDFFAFPTHSYTPKKDAYENKNPLPFETKMKFLKEFFPNTNFIVESSQTLFEALEWLVNQGYNKVYMVAGSDRAQNFKETVEPYLITSKMGDPEKAIDLSFFEVVNIGQRVDESNNIEGVSGTKARIFAIEGKKEDFFKLIPGNNNKLKEELYKELRNSLGVLK